MQRGYSPSPKPAFRNTRSKFFKKKQSQISKQPSPTSHENTGDHWKNKGNQAFTKGFYQTAIDCYTKAIEINDSESIYFSNRAKCYKNINEVEKALKDAEIACELDDQNIKAHYLCGCILAEASKKDQSKINKAESRLKKALRLCDTLKKNQFVDSISIKLFRLRKLKYLKQQEKQMQHGKNMQQLIQKSHSKGMITKQQRDKMLKAQKQRNTRKARQIPDHLLCKITLDLMQQPVTTELGFSYEKSALQQQLKKASIDPMTRQPIKNQLYTNQALKQAIQAFLQDNPWAFEYTDNQSYSNIQF